MLNTQDIANLVADEETGAFHVISNPNFTQPDEVYPVMGDVDGDTLKVFYSNGQVLELTAKWTQLPADHAFFNKD